MAIRTYEREIVFPANTTVTTTGDINIIAPKDHIQFAGTLKTNGIVIIACRSFTLLGSIQTPYPVYFIISDTFQNLSKTLTKIRTLFLFKEPTSIPDEAIKNRVNTALESDDSYISPHILMHLILTPPLLHSDFALVALETEQPDTCTIT